MSTIDPRFGALPSAEPTDAPQLQAVHAAETFEALFITEMLRHMRQAARDVAANDNAARDRSNDDMLDMADTLLAATLAGRHAFGIADAMLRALKPTSASVAHPEEETTPRAGTLP